MKKLPIPLVLGVLALTACTSEETINPEPLHSNAIGFSNVVMKQSRAGDQAVSGDLTNKNLDKFLVYGFYTRENETATPIQVFSGETVTKQDDGTWTYKNTRYWVPGATYNFFAYSCADIALDNTFGTVGLNLNANNPSDRELIISSYRCNKSHNHDLIIAASKNHLGVEPSASSATPNKNVSFKFEHVLTKVDAVFTSEFSSDYNVVIKDVKINNFRDEGDLYTNTGIWKDVERKVANADIQLPFDTADKTGLCRADELNADGTVKTPGLKAYTSSVFMLPYHYEHHDVQLAFTIELYKIGADNKQTLIMNRNMIGTWSPQWDKGTYYTYNIRLTGTAANLQPIVFETAKDQNGNDDAVGGWNPGSSTATDISFSAN